MAGPSTIVLKRSTSSISPEEQAVQVTSSFISTPKVSGVRPQDSQFLDLPPSQDGIVLNLNAPTFYLNPSIRRLSTTEHVVKTNHNHSENSANTALLVAGGAVATVGAIALGVFLLPEGIAAGFAYGGILLVGAVAAACGGSPQVDPSTEKPDGGSSPKLDSQVTDATPPPQDGSQPDSSAMDGGMNIPDGGTCMSSQYIGPQDTNCDGNLSLYIAP